MKRFLLLGLIFGGMILLFLLAVPRGTEKEKKNVLVEGTKQKMLSPEEEQQVYIPPAERKVEKLAVNCEEEWRSVTSSVIDLISNFEDRVAYYSPDLANFLSDNLKKKFSVSFEKFFRDYKRLTDALLKKELLQRLGECRRRVFTSLSSGIVRIARKKIEDSIPEESLRRNFREVDECSFGIIVYSVKLFSPEELRERIQEYRRGLPIVEDRKMIAKLPYVVIPIYYKILLTEIAAKIDEFMQRSGMR